MAKAKPINIIKAYEYYLLHQNVGNKEICQMYNCSPCTAIKLKAPVIDAMAKAGLYLPNGMIDLKIAFEVWGVDEKSLEHKYSKIKKYGIQVG